MDFQQHELVWTPEKTKRFWDWMSNEPAYDDLYFSELLGEAIIDFALRRGKMPRSGAILDFGCGPGYLMEKMLRAGIPCVGAEFSPGTVRKATARIGNHPLFRGITQIDQLPLPHPQGSFDFIFLIETVEHLWPEALEGTLRETYRLLKQAGRIMVTTPHRETLKASSVLCPDCGAIFHRMQHLRSWTEESLRVEMEDKGFRTVLCGATTLLNPGLEGTLIRFLRSARSVLMRKPPKHEHLIYIGERS